MNEMELSLDATAKRSNRDNRRAQRAYGYIGTAEGQALASRAIGQLSDFIERELAHPVLDMPDGLVTVLCQLDPDTDPDIIALVGLAGLLNSIAERDRDDEDDDPRKYALGTTLAIGKELRFECLARKLLAGEGELKRDIERKAARIPDRRRRESFVEYWIEKRGYSSGDWSEELIFDSGTGSSTAVSKHSPIFSSSTNSGRQISSNSLWRQPRQLPIGFAGAGLPFV